MSIKIPLSITLKTVRKAFRQAAPDVLKEAFVELLELTNVEKARGWVDNNVYLWGQLSKGIRQHIIKAACMLLAKDVSWLTFDWVIEAVKEGNPELATYLSEDEDASKWLKNQIGFARREIHKCPCPLEEGRPKPELQVTIENVRNARKKKSGT